MSSSSRVRIYMAPLADFGNLSRLVRRNDDAVRAVLIGGSVASSRGQASEDLGEERRYGQVLRAGEQHSCAPASLSTRASATSDLVAA